MYTCWSVGFTEGCGNTGAPLGLLPSMSTCSTLAVSWSLGWAGRGRVRQLLLGFYLVTLKYSQVGWDGGSGGGVGGDVDVLTI